MKDTRDILSAIGAITLRGLIDKANSMGIQKGSVVTVLRENETYFLLYYRSTVETE